MAKADLHVHSKFSSHPSEWFLQRIGASESYTEPDYIYRAAKERGMSFVTITDHNCIDGALYLKEKHPDDTFLSMEATSYFPVDGCKVHILLYDITEEQFREAQRLRPNVFDLHAYIREHGLAHSVAHATYSINGRLTTGHLEELILMFDVFEGINASRTRLNNEPWSRILSSLTPRHIETLADKHGIEPSPSSPWLKGFTGGSDDHSGMFIARGYTHAEARNVTEFIENIRGRHSIAEGRYSNYQALAFTIYKIAYDFSKTKSTDYSQSLITQINERLFDTRNGGYRNWFRFKTYKAFRKRRATSVLQERYIELYEAIADDSSTDIDTKLEVFYDKLGLISDDFFRILLSSIERDIQKGDIFSFLKSLSSSLPGIFLAIPFFSTLRHLFMGRRLVDDFASRMDASEESGSRHILWFTDTLSYMNGVSKTVCKIGWLSYLRHADLHIVTSLPDAERTEAMPPNVINLPCIHEFSLPYYEHYLLRVPSLLRSIKELHRLEPDEIVISTPGPMGLFGLLVARMFNAKAVGVFHTDFALQAREIVNDESIDGLVESYMKWFYSLCDEIRVPTREYVRILDGRGYDSSRMTVFRRGVDSVRFAPRKTGRAFLRETFGIGDGPVLMFAGRISRDKNIPFLLELFREVRTTHPGANLVVAGTGPDLEKMRRKYAGDRQLVFTGELEHDILPELYSGADVFVFPSTTDTFGMAVLEAQSCGLPAVVSDRGGPQEIIERGVTGFVAADGDLAQWTATVLRIIELAESTPERYDIMRRAARTHALTNYDWNDVIADIIGGRACTGDVPVAPAQDLGGRQEPVDDYVAVSSALSGA